MFEPIYVWFLFGVHMSSDGHVYVYVYVYVHVHVHIYIYICVCVCVLWLSSHLKSL
jgi:hypothetical protein